MASGFEKLMQQVVDDHQRGMLKLALGGSVDEVTHVRTDEDRVRAEEARAAEGYRLVFGPERVVANRLKIQQRLAQVLFRQLKVKNKKDFESRYDIALVFKRDRHPDFVVCTAYIKDKLPSTTAAA